MKEQSTRATNGQSESVLLKHAPFTLLERGTEPHELSQLAGKSMAHPKHVYKYYKCMYRDGQVGEREP